MFGFLKYVGATWAEKVDREKPSVTCCVKGCKPIKGRAYFWRGHCQRCGHKPR